MKPKPSRLSLTPFPHSHGLSAADVRKISASLQDSSSRATYEQLISADGCKALLDQLGDVQVARGHAPELLTEQHIDWVLELAQRALIHVLTANQIREAGRA